MHNEEIDMNVTAITQILTISQYLNVSELRAIECHLQQKRLDLQSYEAKVLKDIETELNNRPQ